MKNFICVLMLTAGATGVLGQAPDTLWTRTYGGSGFDIGYSVSRTTDGGCVAVGHIQSAGYEDVFLARLNSIGDTMWTRSYGGMWNDRGTVVITLSDGFFIAGYTDSYGNNGDIYVLKVSSTGDTVWTRPLGGPTNEYTFSATQTSDDGFVVVGFRNYGAGDQDVYLVKLDSLGNQEWERGYGGTGEQIGYGIHQTSDGGYIICGSTSVYGSGFDVYLVKTDQGGDTLWTRHYGGSFQDEGFAVRQLRNGDYLVVGRAATVTWNQMYGLCMRINVTGDSIWARTYGTVPTEFWSVLESPGLGFATAGQSNYDAVIVRLSDDGDTLWTRSFDRGTGTQEGFFKFDFTSSWGYYGCGFANGFGSGDIYLVKTTADPSNYGITSPDEGESWQIFTTDTVRWLGVGFEGGVRIELNRSYPSGSWEVLADSTENDGEFIWFVTDPLSDNCRVRVSAVADTFSDISDGDFSIVSSQGYLALVRLSAPSTPVLSWGGGTVECPSGASEVFRLKNFGSEAIVVFQPLEPMSSEFSRTTSCGGFFALAPGQMSACSLTLTFDAAADGLYRDTLLIQTDAVNQQGGYVRIPLSGTQISTPATPQIVITVSGEDAVLYWNAITESVGGCPVNVTRYLVFYADDTNGPYLYHGWTSDTTYTHEGVITYASGMYYQAVCVAGSVDLSRLVEGMTRAEVEESVLPYRQKFGLEN